MPDEHTGVVRENYLWKVRLSLNFWKCVFDT